VGDLQAALQLLLDRGIILLNDESGRRELSAALQREPAKQSYSSATRKLVSIFRNERQLEGRGRLGERTAKVLNRLLDELSGPEGEGQEFILRAWGKAKRTNKVFTRSGTRHANFKAERGGADTLSSRPSGTMVPCWLRKRRESACNCLLRI
jgi:hypothetical protein